MLGDEVDEREGAECCHNFLKHHQRTYPRTNKLDAAAEVYGSRIRPWVFKLIDEGWEGEVVEEMAVCHILRPDESIRPIAFQLILHRIDIPRKQGDSLVG